MSVRIDFSHSPVDFDNARKLLIDYAESLGFSLSFQGFEDELEYLPGKYAATEGCIFLGWDELDCEGCVGLRPLSDDVCEKKRLYVKPLYRGIGLGRLLAEKIMQLGIDKKYTIMPLDTLNSMQSAVGLYKSLGFVETDQYYNNPHPEVVFFELTLD
jgi:GNAT superfamily N-acetyltransferase